LFEGVEQTHNGALATGHCCVYFIIEVTGWISSKFDGRAYIESRWGNFIMDYIGLRL